jgi:hypothetical protein
MLFEQIRFAEEFATKTNPLSWPRPVIAIRAILRCGNPAGASIPNFLIRLGIALIDDGQEVAYLFYTSFE